MTASTLRHAPLAIAIAALLGGACAKSASARLPLVACHLDGVAQEVLCGTFEIPEDRATAAGRRLTLAVAVLPAQRRGAAPDPLVVLAGGPGQGARSYAALANTAFARVRRTRDIVLVDLRGTGGSHPLHCPQAPRDLNALIGDASSGVDPVRCLETLDADVRHYTTESAVADLDDVLSALGYGRVNLWGGSFGTRTALVFARRFPERVRTMVLDGAAPFDLTYPLWTAADAQRALALLLDDCDRDADCRHSFRDLRRDLDALFRRLDAEPETVALRHPISGEPQTVRIDRDALASALRLFLYTPAHRRLVPAVFTEASRGRFEPLVALALEGYAWSIDTMSLGLTLSVVCSEDVPRIAANDVDAAVRRTFVQRSAVDAWLRLCREWPKGPPPERVDEVISIDAPALILSGVLDPVTPPRWGESMGRHFARSAHVVVPGAAHNASFTGCVPELIAAFLATANPSEVDATCANATRRPPFVIGFSGPTP